LAAPHFIFAIQQVISVRRILFGNHYHRPDITFLGCDADLLGLSADLLRLAIRTRRGEYKNTAKITVGAKSIVFGSLRELDFPSRSFIKKNKPDDSG
jgi:hypothetical protein